MQVIYDEFNSNMSSKFIEDNYCKRFLVFLKISAISIPLLCLFIIYLFVFRFIGKVFEPQLFLYITCFTFAFILLSVNFLINLKKKSILTIQNELSIRYIDYKKIFTKELKEYQKNWIYNLLIKKGLHNKDDLICIYSWLQTNQIVQKAYKNKKTNLFLIVLVAFLSVFVQDIYIMIKDRLLTLSTTTEIVLFIIAVILIIIIIIGGFQFNINQFSSLKKELFVEDKRRTYRELENIIQELILEHSRTSSNNIANITIA